MTENKLVPKLRFLEFNDNWQQKTLGDVGDLINGLTYSPKDITDDGVLVLRSSNVQNNQLAFEDNVYVNVESFNPVKENDILICVRNGSKRLIGKNCLIDKNNEGVAFGAFMTVYRSINNKFIFHLFSLSSYYKTIHQNLGATINSINNNDLKKFKFFFPSLPEQQKLASFLSAVDEKLEQLTKKKELLEKYKKGVMQKIFSQELRFKDANGNNYPDWEENNLGKICSVIKGKQLNKSELTETGLYPALNGGINPSGYTDKWNTEKDVITISEGGNSCGYVNLSKTRFWCGGHCYSLLKLQSNINFKYLFQMLKFSEAHIMRLRVGSGLPNIQMKEINKFSVKIPEIDEQQKIANFLSSLDRKIELVSTQIESTKSFKKGLLQQMFV